MKKTVMFIVLTLAILASFSVAFASESVYSSDTEWVEGGSDNTRTWYYAPEFTQLNTQGRLETWTKAKYTGKDIVINNIVIMKTGEYAIYHTFVTPDCTKYMETETAWFTPEGSLVKTSTKMDPKWQDIYPGSLFERCYQAALTYAKNK